MATFYTHIEKNVLKTWTLISVFLIFIIGVGWFFSYFFNSQIILLIAVIISVTQAFLSYFYSDKIILSMVKARRIEKEDNPELYRIVENLSIAAGLPMPRVYIMDELQPNAFATGRNPKHSAVVVTIGLLKKLEKPELEGVIAHELSHIKNKDILLGSVVVVLVGVVALISDFFLRSLFWFGPRRDSEREGGGIFLILGIIAAILAPIAATLIRLAISRKREFLADASAVLLTRYPEGLARALEKIASDKSPLRVAKNATSHLFIVSPLKGSQTRNWFAKIFMTHPPIEERIKALREMEIQ